MAHLEEVIRDAEDTSKTTEWLQLHVEELVRVSVCACVGACVPVSVRVCLCLHRMQSCTCGVLRTACSHVRKEYCWCWFSARHV